VRESLLFPYHTGLRFVMGIHGAGGWDAVNDVFGSPPDSTEQVLHPEKYSSREAPVEVSLPADLAARMGEGWTQTIDDTFGEFQVAAWLRAIGVTEEADAAAAGWGGDRIALLEGPQEAWAIVWETAWDTSDEAQEFATAAQVSSGADLSLHDGDRVTLILGSDDATRERAAAAGG
jgi:hypothetical protein